MTRCEELSELVSNIEEVKKPFALALIKDFCRWEEIEQDLLATALYKVEKFKGEPVAKELPSFKMLNTATSRKEDAIKSLMKLIEGEVGEESQLAKALNKFNSKYGEVEYR